MLVGYQYCSNPGAYRVIITKRITGKYDQIHEHRLNCIKKQEKAFSLTHIHRNAFINTTGMSDITPNCLQSLPIS